MWSRVQLPDNGPANRNESVATSPAGRPKASSRREFERSLVNALLSGEAGAAKRFLDHTSTTLWSIVAKLEGDGSDGEAAFLHVVTSLEADGGSRLKGFDGRARLSTYLSLVVRDIAGDRLARQFSEAPHEAWPRFARFFESDIRGRVARQLPRNSGNAEREDAYQEICLKLIEDDFRRIRAYNGRGSFTGYVLTVVDRILIDLIRREVPRRRLPATVARSTVLDRAVYAAVVWDGCPQDVGRLAAALRGRLEWNPDAVEVSESLARVTRMVRLRPAPTSHGTDAVSLDVLVEHGGGLSLADPSPTPEDWVLLAEEERSRAALVAAVKAAAADLPSDERLYLQIVFSANEPLPARRIARLMGCPLEQVYRLKQRTQRWLKDMVVRLQPSSDISV